jgi:hypothetical protein
VAARWKKLFGMPTLVRSYLAGKAGRAEADAARVLLTKWRSRLLDVSWYMRCLNEHLARRANAEDEVTGRFWEGRFKSQALLDEAGLLTAMAYVDLNPIRAGAASSPETSKFTSIYQRIRAIKQRPVKGPGLAKFHGQAAKHTLPCSQEDYLKLIDWTGRAIRGGQGRINAKLPPILIRLNINQQAWQAMMKPNGNVFGRAMGPINHLRLHAQALGQQWVKGLRAAERMYRTP